MSRRPNIGDTLYATARRALLLGLAVIIAITIATPAHADPVKPRRGEGIASMTSRTCGTATNWRAVAAANGINGPRYTVYYGQTYNIDCSGQTLVRSERASRAVSRSGWVHPLASGVLARNAGACPGAPRSGHAHAGIDLTAGTGTPIRAVAAGRITISRWSGTAGWYVRIDHGSTTSTYMHLVRQGLRAGTQVAAGQTIGHVGATGNAKGPHLHFEATGAGNTAQTARANGLRLGC